ncbi:hypothetical protein [Hymenobacter canadensis]|uniref:Lipoprotein n=1 Tax=Hymenobacter canadensis TaxID=2999067 RepID=A0ABY7LNP5_9BACT|nr:hypothetical protein [Hymenobacter canadensis]WBA42047.1 hypothetical protein O3303_00465 [Hymenobacter canadensis]
MKALPYASLLLAATLFSGCAKQEVTPEQASVVGSWQWQSSFCGWGGASSPATTGTTRQLIIGADGQAKMLENGVLRYVTPYVLSRHTSLLKKQETDFITFTAQQREYMVEVSPQTRTLSLADDTYDGCGETYSSASGQ